MRNNKINQYFSIVKNNWFMLKYVFKYSSKVVIFRFIGSIIEVIVTYVSLNLSKWIFDGLEFGIGITVVVLILLWGLNCVIINLYSCFCEVLYYPLKKIIVSKEIFLDYIYKSAKIDQFKILNFTIYILVG